MCNSLFLWSRFILHKKSRNFKWVLLTLAFSTSWEFPKALTGVCVLHLTATGRDCRYGYHFLFSIFITAVKQAHFAITRMHNWSALICSGNEIATINVVALLSSIRNLFRSSFCSNLTNSSINFLSKIEIELEHLKFACQSTPTIKKALRPFFYRKGRGTRDPGILTYNTKEKQSRQIYKTNETKWVLIENDPNGTLHKIALVLSKNFISLGASIFVDWCVYWSSYYGCFRRCYRRYYDRKLNHQRTKKSASWSKGRTVSALKIANQIVFHFPLLFKNIYQRGVPNSIPWLIKP